MKLTQEPLPTYVLELSLKELRILRTIVGSCTGGEHGLGRTFANDLWSLLESKVERDPSINFKGVFS